MVVFTSLEAAKAYARAACVAYGRTMYVNEREGWPVYVTSYPTRHTVEGMRNG